MQVAETVWRYASLALWCTTLLLAACAQSPRPAPEPVLHAQASQAHNDGLRAYARGDLESAARHLEQALRLQQSLDDGQAMARTRLHLATVALAMDQTQAALLQLQAVQAMPEVKEAGVQTRLWQLQAQAHLALKDTASARQVLSQALAACTTGCDQRGSLLFLQARLDLALQQAEPALAALQLALPLLQAQAQAVEVANVWRLRAAAHLLLKQNEQALSAAQSALTQDRQLGLPEKIAQDWLLLGDIYQQSAQADPARSAYARALSVATAAGLTKVQSQARERMQRLP